MHLKSFVGVHIFIFFSESQRIIVSNGLQKEKCTSKVLLGVRFFVMRMHF